jgi:hypothetical protein
MAIQCQINLISWPNPGKTNNPMDCVGTATGVWVARHDTAPGGVVVATALNSFTRLSWQYTDPCVFGALGFVNGTGRIFNVTVVSMTKNGSTTGEPGTITFPFAAVRVGAALFVTVGKLNPLLDAKKGQQARITWSSGSAVDAVGGAGEGTFLPLGVPGFVCPGGPLTSLISMLIEGV